MHHAVSVMELFNLKMVKTLAGSLARSEKEQINAGVDAINIS